MLWEESYSSQLHLSSGPILAYAMLQICMCLSMYCVGPNGLILGFHLQICFTALAIWPFVWFSLECPDLFSDSCSGSVGLHDLVRALSFTPWSTLGSSALRDQPTGFAPWPWELLQCFDVYAVVSCECFGIQFMHKFTISVLINKQR